MTVEAKAARMTLGPPAGKQVRHIPTVSARAFEPGGRQQFAEQFKRTALLWCNRSTADKVGGQLDCIGVFHVTSFCLAKLFQGEYCPFLPNSRWIIKVSVIMPVRRMVGI